jgi:glutaconate CoA-transferase, subunit B
MMDTPAYNPAELLICVAARIMEDNTTAFIGTGIPMLAAALAQKLYAPNLMAVFEFGGFGARMKDLPLGVGERRTFYRAVIASGICDTMEAAARGFIEYGFLGGAQIDAYGNLNSTVIGEYAHPKARLPGSGGANDVSSLCWRTIAIMTQHDKRRFVPKVDFVTTPGFLTGPGARERAGLAPGAGPYRVVSGLATLGYDDDTKRMKLLAVNPGVTVHQVIDNTGFDLVVAEQIGENSPPTEKELHALRTEVDPGHLYI